MRLSRYTVMLDACVLYPAPLRDLLLELAATDLFRAKWTEQIEQEWIRSLLANRPDLDHDRLVRTCILMRKAVLDCEVTGYEDLIGGLTLPDPNDRHVLAAAIHAKCDAIITHNRAHFPSDIVGKFDIEVLHPDDFLHFQFGFSDATVVSSARRIRGRLTRPTVQPREYIDRLESLGLPKIAAELRRYESIL